MKKRYRWLKLQDDFFNRLAIKKILKSENSYKLLTVYLKLQIEYIKTEGLIEKETNYSLNEELSIKLDIEIEIIEELFEILKDTNAISLLDDEKILLNEVSQNLGSENASAERVRKFREKKKQKGE